MKRLLTIGALFGGLLLFSIPSNAGDIYQAAANAYGAPRFTANVFGRNLDADTTEDSIWEGSDLAGPIRCFDVIGTTAVALYISSDDEDDGSDNNAISVTVEALDANWDPVTIEAPLGAASAGGTLFVQVGSVTLMRVNRAYVSTTTAVQGNIYIHTDSVDGGTDGVPDTILTELVASIAIGRDETHQACYTVPNNYNGFLTNFCTTNVDTGANAVMQFFLRSSVNGATSRVQESLQLAETVYQCTQHAPVGPPIVFGEMTDIELTSDSSANNAQVSGSFDLILIKNTISGL